MFKAILSLAILFTGFSAFARYPDGQCSANETKLIYESLIAVGKRVQLISPLLCTNGRYYPILAIDGRHKRDNHTSGLCSLYQLGTAVFFTIRTVDHEELASFDEDGGFLGVADFNLAEGYEIWAVKSITCETSP